MDYDENGENEHARAYARVCARIHYILYTDIFIYILLYIYNIYIYKNRPASEGATLRYAYGHSSRGITTNDTRCDVIIKSH